MTLSQQQFFWFLRAGLWGLPKEDCPGGESVDWTYIFPLAKRQTVLLLLEDGVDAWMQKREASLPESAEIPPLFLLKIENIRKLTQQAHSHQEQLLCRCRSLLQTDGIPFFLLKGESLAALYSHPQSRSCGDIDLYVDKDDYNRAFRLLSTGFQVHGNLTDKHACFKDGRIRIELHWQALVPPRPSVRADFLAYTRSELSQARSFVSLPLSREKIAIPPPEYNMIFVLAHLFHHFIEGGVGLRQVCDWAVLLRHHAGSYEWGTLQEKLERFSLMQAWQVFGNIAVRYLGLPPEEVPFYSEAYSQKADRCLDIVMTEGNFGRFGKGKFKRKKDDSYSQRKSKAFQLTMSRLWKKAAIFPWEVLCYLPSWIGESFGRLCSHR